MSKFKARYIVVPLIVAAVAGGVFGIVKYRESKNIVKVAPVSGAIEEASMMAESDEGDKYYGKLRKGSYVNVKVDTELKIESVNVKKGDTVKKGEVLIKYDIHDLQDSLADAELDVKTITNEIEIIQNDLDILTRLQPSENKPREEEPEEEEEEEETDTDSDSDSDSDKETPDKPAVSESKFEPVITEKSMPLLGTGAVDDPITYAVGVETVVSKEYLTALAAAGQSEPIYAAFYVYSEEDALLFVRVIDSSKIDPKTVEDFPVSDGVKLTPDGMISFSGSSAEFASFVTAPAEGQSMPGGADGTELPEGFMFPEGFQLPEGFEMPEQAPVSTDTDAAPYELSLNDHYMYSLQELKDMIAAKEKEKAALDLQKRQAELNVKTISYRAETGGEVAEIDGVVSFVAKDIYHLSESGAYMTITNDAGMSISALVGEFSLYRVEKGMTATISNFETGAETTGTVVEISDTPADSKSLTDFFADDTMESQYSFTVVLDEDIEIAENSDVQIAIDQAEDSKGFYIPSPLVRTEAGRYYVMAANDQNILEKRYVEVGGTAIVATEILSGLSEDDLIAFPYGKAVDGAAVTETNFMDMYYNFGLFY